MSEQLHEQTKRLPFGFTVDAGEIRAAIVQNLHRLERETNGDDYIPLWTAPRLLGITNDELVFLIVCSYVPAPELLNGGLFFYRSTFIESLQRVEKWRVYGDAE